MPTEQDWKVLKDNQELVVEFAKKHFPEESTLVVSTEAAKGGDGIDVGIRVLASTEEQDAHTYMRNTNRIQSFLLAIAAKFAVPFKSIRIHTVENVTIFRFTI